MKLIILLFLLMGCSARKCINNEYYVDEVGAGVYWKKPHIKCTSDKDAIYLDVKKPIKPQGENHGTN